MTRKSLLVWLLAVLICSTAKGEDWASKMFETTKHDFGSVAKSAKTEFEFVLNNIYLEDVHVASVRSSCGCTRVSIKTPWLKTYEKGAIVANINTKSFHGHKPATITVTFDRPRYAQVRLRTDVNIRTDVTIEPDGAAMGTIDQGVAVEKKIRVTRHGQSDWQILEVKCSNPHISGEATEIQRSRGRVTYELTVRLDENAPAGHVRDHLMLVTNDRRSEQVPVPVEAMVQAVVTVSPASLFMGVVRQGERVTRQLVVRAKTPFRIMAVRCDDACFEFGASTEEQPKALHLVPVTFVADGAPGKVLQTIRIETDLSDVPPELSAYVVISP